MTDGGYNPCHRSLKFIKLRGTRVRKDGLRLLLNTCLALEGLRCNVMDILQALSTYIKDDQARYDGSSLTLKYFDFSSCYQIFSSKLHFLMNLREVRIGADVPPECKTSSRKHRNDFKLKPPTEEVCHGLLFLGSLRYLETLVLKDLNENELEAALGSCGMLLRRLEIHFMSSGVNLEVINQLAPNITTLLISDSKIICSTDHAHTKKYFFKNLTQCRLMRVYYENRSETCILSHCDLKSLYQESAPAITDDLIDALIDNNKLRNLEELIFTGICFLSTQSLIKIMQLPSINLVGDIMDWSISRQQYETFLSKHKESWKTSKKVIK